MMYQFRGIRLRRDQKEKEENRRSYNEKKKGYEIERNEEEHTRAYGEKIRCIYVFIHISEFKFRILRWHMAPGDTTIGVPWSAIGCSFRSRRPSIFEQDRSKMSRGTVTARPFPSVRIYPGKGGSTLAVNSK